MGRPRSGSQLSISQLEFLLQSRRAQIEVLVADRDKIRKQLAHVNEKISKLGGDAASEEMKDLGTRTLTPSGRVRNLHSLVETMKEVITRAGTPMKVIDIVQAVTESGYRSNSTTFRAIVNQTLIKERKNFVQTARATYDVKK